MLSRDDLHEKALQALVECHTALGERAQAVRLHQRYAARLHEEFEIEPGSELSGFVERLRRDAAHG